MYNAENYWNSINVYNQIEEISFSEILRLHGFMLVLLKLPYMVYKLVRNALSNITFYLSNK